MDFSSRGSEFLLNQSSQLVCSLYKVILHSLIECDWCTSVLFFSFMSQFLQLIWIKTCWPVVNHHLFYWNIVCLYFAWQSLCLVSSHCGMIILDNLASGVVGSKWSWLIEGVFMLYFVFLWVCKSEGILWCQWGHSNFYSLILITYFVLLCYLVPRRQPWLGCRAGLYIL